MLRVLLSFLQASEIDLDRLHGLGSAEVFVDSGAFSARSIGATVNIADYAAWLRDWRHVITTAANLDVIGDHVASRRNLEKLESRGLDVLPVFHAGSPWAELERLCRCYPYVGLGGAASSTSAGGRVLMQWLIKCHRIGRDHGTVFHGFGMTAPRIVGSLPFYSVDSSTWQTGLRYGSFGLWDDRRGRFHHVAYGDRAVCRVHRALIRAHGGDPTLMARPGFGLLRNKPYDDYKHEQRMGFVVSAASMLRFEQWARRRHHVPAPPGRRSPGPCVFLVVARDSEVDRVAEAYAVTAAGDANPPAPLRSRS